MSFRLIVPEAVHQAMIAHALATQPVECCGLLAGVIEDGLGLVRKGYPLINVLNRPDEFESEPRSMFDAVRDLNANGHDILAVYHSHPTSPPIPSRKDRERNYSEDVVNVIISLLTQPPEVRVWWLTAQEYREAAWEVRRALE